MQRKTDPGNCPIWLLLKTENCSPIAAEFACAEKFILNNYLVSNMLFSGLNIVVRNTGTRKCLDWLTFKTRNSSPIAFEFSCPDKTSCRQLPLAFCFHLVSSLCCEKRKTVTSNCPIWLLLKTENCSPIATEFSWSEKTHSRQLLLQQFVSIWCQHCAAKTRSKYLSHLTVVGDWKL